MYHKKSEKGQALILIALAIVGMLALTATAVDGGNAYSERRRAQNAADATALDAALAKVREGDLYTEGLARADSNHYTDADPTSGFSSPDVNVEIYNPPISGTYSDCGNPDFDCGEYIQVFITATIKTYFGGVIGRDEVTNQVEAVARAKPGVSSPLAFGNAVVGLSPHDCKALFYSGSSNVTLIGSGMFGNSDCASAFFNNSNSPGTDLTAPCLSVVGGITYNPGSLDIPSDCLSGGAGSWGYPPANIIMPDPVCTGNATVSGSTMTPGNYSGAFPPNGVTTLQSGIYCVNAGNQGFDYHSSTPLVGHDVVIRMNSGGVSWTGNIQLDAPDSGPYSGLLMYLPMSNSSAITINGGTNSSLTGSILAPASDVNVLGGGGTDGLHTQVVGFTVKLGGSSDLKLVYNSAEQYAPPSPPTIELIQ